MTASSAQPPLSWRQAGGKLAASELAQVPRYFGTLSWSPDLSKMPAACRPLLDMRQHCQIFERPADWRHTRPQLRLMAERGHSSVRHTVGGRSVMAASWRYRGRARLLSMDIKNAASRRRRADDIASPSLAEHGESSPSRNCLNATSPRNHVKCRPRQRSL